MESSFEEESKLKILKGYLRSFFISVPDKLIKKLDKMKISPCNNDYFVCGDRRIFRSFVAYYLLKDGRKDWDYLNVYELIEIYLGKREEISSIFELNKEFVIMSHGNEEFENKRQWDIINQYIAFRSLEKKRSLLFSFDTMHARSLYNNELSTEIKVAMKYVDLTKFEVIS